MFRYFLYCLLLTSLVALWGCKSDEEVDKMTSSSVDENILEDAKEKLNLDPIDPPVALESQPTWVDSPVLKGGLVEVACYPVLEGEDLYRTKAKAKASRQLSESLLEVSKQALTSNSQELDTEVLELIVENDKEALVVFSKELKSLPELKGDYVTQESKRHYCSKVGLLNEELGLVIDKVYRKLKPEEEKPVAVLDQKPESKKDEGSNLVDSYVAHQEEKETSQFPLKPQWVANPETDDGIAYSSCVPKTKDYEEDSANADILAQQQLGRGLLLQMDHLVDSFDQLQPVPEQKMQDLVFANIRLMQRVDGGYYQQEAKEYYCSLVSLSEEKALNLLEDFVGLANRSINSGFTSTQKREITQNRKAFERLDAQLR